MILSGIAKLACGNAKGVDEFSSTPESLGASLAPLIALPLVDAIVSSLSGNWKMEVVSFLSSLCTVLVLPVLVYEFSRLFKRQEQWLRTSTALNWCHWLILPAVWGTVTLIPVMTRLGLPAAYSGLVSIALAELYLLWNSWFILKSGLRINGWRAALILLACQFAMGILASPVLVLVAAKLGVAGVVSPV